MRRQIQVALLLLAACTRGGVADAGPPYTLGVERSGEVRLSTSRGYHVNAEYPVSYVADGGRTALQDAMKLQPCADDATQSCAATVTVPRENGVLAFSVCSRDECLIEKVPLRW